MKKLACLLLALCMMLGMVSVNAEGVPASEIKIGMICIGDENEGYTANHINGLRFAMTNLGIDESQVIFKYNIPETEAAYEAAVDLAEQGCDIIFANSFGHETYVFLAAEEYPEIEFCHATGTQAHTAGLANFHNAFAHIYEGRYLAGVVAGLKLKEMIDSGKITADKAKMGYVGAFTFAEVISGYTSFYLGAKSIVPEVTMDVKFTGSWYDEAKEKQAAQALIDNGCVLISQHADSMGAPTACESAGVPNVSYNGSTAAACPNTFLVSSRINWVPYFEYMIGQVQKGEAIDTDWAGDLENGAVAMTELGTAVAPGTAEKLAEVKAQLIADEINVFATANFTIHGAKLSTYFADVDTDPNYTPDTEAIANGVFQESKFRSGPYFDLRIDGITLLDEAYG